MCSFNETSNIYHMKKSWNFAENQHNYLLIKQYRKMNNQTYSFCACNSSPSCTVSNVGLGKTNQSMCTLKSRLSVVPTVSVSTELNREYYTKQ